MKTWSELERNIVFGPAFGRYVEQASILLPNGKRIDDYYLFNMGNWSVIMALTPENKAILLREYKHGIGKAIWMFPGGTHMPGEDPEENIRRELLAETGYQAERIVPLGESWMHVTNSASRGFCFLSTGCRKVQEQELEETETLEVNLVNLDRLYELITSGELNESSSVVTAIRGLHYLGWKR